MIAAPMFDPEDPIQPKRPRSLLSLTARAREQASPTLATPAPSDQARDVAPSPPEVFLADEPARISSPEHRTDEPAPHRLLRSLRARLSRSSAIATERSAPLAMSPEPPARPAPVPSVQAYTADENPYWRPLIDPLAVVNGVWRSKLLIVATTVVGGIIGVAIALSTPKLYEATAELLVDPRELKIVERDLTATALPSDGTLAIVENQVRVLVSGSVLTQVVDQLGLASDPEFNGEGGGLSLRGLIADLRAALSGETPGGDAEAKRSLAVSNLADSLDVSRSENTFVISATASTRDPDKSALIANTLTQVFLDTYGTIQAETAGRASEELKGRLAELRADVEEAERAVQAFKAENDIIDAQGRLIADDEIVKLNDQLAIARARTLELNARAASARTADLDAVLTGFLPEQIVSPVMTELRSQYASLKQDVDRLSVRFGPRHPQRQSAEAQLAGAREQLQAELRRINQSVQVDLQRAVRLEQDLAARLAQLKAGQADLNVDLVTLREMERDASSKRSIYESYLLRARETDQQQSLNTANVSVISEAGAPLTPTGPSRAMISLAGAFLGFLAGIGLGGARGAVESLRDNGRRVQAGRQEPALQPVAASTPAQPQPPLFDDEDWPLEPEPVPPGDAGDLEDIRRTLREVREAVLDLAAARAARSS